MNQNIKAAAIAHAEVDPVHFRSGAISDFNAGAEFFQQSSGADEMAEALAFCLGFVDELKVHGITAWSGEEKAKAALAKYNSFIKTEEDGKSGL